MGPELVCLQAVDHPYLVVHSASGAAASAAAAAKAAAAAEPAEDVLCGVCSDPPEDCKVTACGHSFCKCVSDP